MEKIQIYQNEQFGKVRIAMNENNEPLFCAKDVANALGYADTADAIQRHCKSGEKVFHPHENGIGGTNMIYIPEKDVYRLIMRSNLPDAEKFQDWVCDEVLPSIRKHGAYMTQETLEKALTSPDFLIQLATNLKEEKQKRIEAEQKAEVVKQKIQQDAPKVLFADAVSTSQRSCLVAELAKILQQNGVNIGQNRLFNWMRENGYLCQKGDYYNQPTQKAMKLGLFELKKTSITKPDGSVLVTTTTKVTGKGQIYFVEKFLGKNVA